MPIQSGIEGCNHHSQRQGCKAVGDDHPTNALVHPVEPASENVDAAAIEPQPFRQAKSRQQRRPIHSIEQCLFHRDQGRNIPSSSSSQALACAHFQPFLHPCLELQPLQRRNTRGRNGVEPRLRPLNSMKPAKFHERCPGSHPSSR